MKYFGTQEQAGKLFRAITGTVEKLNTKKLYIKVAPSLKSALMSDLQTLLQGQKVEKGPKKITVMHRKTGKVEFTLEFITESAKGIEDKTIDADEIIRMSFNEINDMFLEEVE